MSDPRTPTEWTVNSQPTQLLGSQLGADEQLIKWASDKRTGQVLYLHDQAVINGAVECTCACGVDLDSQTLPKLITVDMYHCKYSSAPQPGSRIGDMYEVCGQAQRSILWLHNKDRRTDLFAHLLKREALRTENGRATRFEVDTKERLIQIRDLSRTCRVTIRVYIVQPGLSKAEAADHQLAVLGVTEKFLQETYHVPLQVYCS